MNKLSVIRSSKVINGMDEIKFCYCLRDAKLHLNLFENAIQFCGNIFENYTYILNWYTRELRSIKFRKQYLNNLNFS